ncbi:MAG: TonB-dependent receptor [Gemmatimonadetes bacterium]|nr:TonB-dependent receptor [Gemmatimonadota bacterium]
MAKPVEIGLPNALNVAVGATYRQETWQLVPGEKGSWIQGGHVNQFGDPAPPGSQVFSGFLPTTAADESRGNTGAYVDLETDLTKKLLVNAAARFEDYTDFGSNLSWKLAARFQPTKQFVAQLQRGLRLEPDRPVQRDGGRLPHRPPRPHSAHGQYRRRQRREDSRGEGAPDHVGAVLHEHHRYAHDGHRPYWELPDDPRLVQLAVADGRSELHQERDLGPAPPASATRGYRRGAGRQVHEARDREGAARLAGNAHGEPLTRQGGPARARLLLWQVLVGPGAVR